MALIQAGLRKWGMSWATAAVAVSVVGVDYAAAQETGDTGAGVVVAPTKVPDDQPPLRGLLPEPRFMTRGLAEAAKRMDKPGPKRDGFYVRVGTGITGSGWIAAGPGYRHRLFGNGLTFDASSAVSWREYKIAQVKTSGSWFDDRLNAGANAVWEDRTQANYFGSGPSSVLEQRSGYRLRASDYSVFAGVKSRTNWLVDVRAGMLVNPRISSATGWNDPEHPDTLAIFSEATAPGLTAQPNLRHVEVAVTQNRLNYTAHPSRGGLIQFVAGTYRDTELHRYSFNRYEFTLLQMVPVVPDLWTLAVRGTGIVSTTSGTNAVPFYLQPSLGSNNGLRGYLGNRFSDRNLALINLESRWALMPHLDGVFFIDTGEVAPKADLLTSQSWKTSYGFGARFHTGKATLVRIEMARSVEGWRFLFRTNEPLLMSLLKRGFTVAPILP